MDNREAIEILNNSMILTGRANGKTQFKKAFTLAKQALANEAKRKELIMECESKIKEATKWKDYQELFPNKIMIEHLKKCEADNG